jgi:putative heme iron utilization protein
LNGRIDKQIDELVGVFTDPIIVWPSGWQDTLPEWIKPAITMERLIENMKALKGERPTATDAEVLAYMYPRSLEAPLDSDWTQIYLYVSTKVMSRHKETEIPADIKVELLSDYQMQRLKELKDWIYEERVRLRQERRRAERAQAMAEAKAKAPEQLRLGV